VTGHRWRETKRRIVDSRQGAGDPQLLWFYCPAGRKKRGGLGERERPAWEVDNVKSHDMIRDARGIDVWELQWRVRGNWNSRNTAGGQARYWGTDLFPRAQVGVKAVAYGLSGP